MIALKLKNILPDQVNAVYKADLNFEYKKKYLDKWQLSMSQHAVLLSIFRGLKSLYFHAKWRSSVFSASIDGWLVISTDDH